VHPLLRERRSLLAYLVVWAGLAIVPAVLLRADALLGALFVSVVSTVAFALFTLPAWYLCRALPLTRGNGRRVMTAHSVAALVFSLGFYVVFDATADCLSYAMPFRALPNAVDQAEGAVFAVGALFYLLVASFHYVLAALEERSEAAERQGALALSAQRAELSALRAQVHPHFLFNSLNTVSALTGYDPAKAREACVLLGEYLRGTLRGQERALVSLGDEWGLSERYLTVEALRLGDRLKVEAELPADARACLVPSLLLQPLVENAMTHGIATVGEPAPLRVSAERRGERLAIRLENGFEPAPRRREGGLGLANVRARLAAHYGDDASLRIEREPERFIVVLDLPARTADTLEAP
jgi:two-component system sensor histidine kinase AlgZ